MRFSLTRRSQKILAGVVGTGLVAAGIGGYVGRYDLKEQWLRHQWADKHYNASVMEKSLMIAGPFRGKNAILECESALLPRLRAQRSPDFRCHC